MGGKQGQFAMEYLLVVGFSLLVIIPVSAMLYQAYQDERADVHEDHLVEIARELVYQAERVAAQGAPSTTTVEFSLPAGVQQAAVNAHDITFRLEGSSIDLYAESDIALAGSLETFQGRHRVMIVADDGDTPDPADDRVRIIDT